MLDPNTVTTTTPGLDNNYPGPQSLDGWSSTPDDTGIAGTQGKRSQPIRNSSACREAPISLRWACAPLLIASRRLTVREVGIMHRHGAMAARKGAGVARKKGQTAGCASFVHHVGCEATVLRAEPRQRRGASPQERLRQLPVERACTTLRLRPTTTHCEQKAHRKEGGGRWLRVRCCC